MGNKLSIILLICLFFSLFSFGCASNIDFKKVKETINQTNAKGTSSKDSVPIKSNQNPISKDCNVERITCEDLCNDNTLQSEKEGCNARCSNDYYICAGN